MPYLKKVKISGNYYFYLFHTVRDGDKFRKLSRYIGKKEPSKDELEKLKDEFTKKIKKDVLEDGAEESVPRMNILAILKEMQRKYGCLPEDKVRGLSEKIGMRVIEIYSAATFYSMLSTDKKGKKVIRICNSPACYLGGSLNILEEAKKLLQINVDETTKDGRFTLELASCIGCCDRAPAIMVNDELITGVNKERLKQLLR